MDAVETIKYKNHKIEIKHDNQPESPREWSNICVLHIAHKRYNFGDENYNDYESIQEAAQEAIRNGDIVLPLYMYEHSGITISLTPFSCRFDSGQVGFVQVPRKKMLNEFNKKIFTKQLKEKALKIAKGEVQSFDVYLRGEVVGYVIDEGEDSCWGYYDVEYALKEAKNMVDWIVEQKRKKHCEHVKI